jgi:hypothetical protein
MSLPGTVVGGGAGARRCRRSPTRSRRIQAELINDVFGDARVDGERIEPRSARRG